MKKNGIENDIEFKKWIALKNSKLAKWCIKYNCTHSGECIISNTIFDDDLIMKHLMRCVEVINTSSGEYFLNMGNDGWIVYRFIGDGRQGIVYDEHFKWSKYKGMQAALLQAIHWVYLQDKKK